MKQISDETYELLKVDIEKLENPGRFKPNVMCRYFIINEKGVVVRKVNANQELTDEHYDAYNMFKTEEEAELCSKVQTAFRKRWHEAKEDSDCGESFTYCIQNLTKHGCDISSYDEDDEALAEWFDKRIRGIYD